MRIGLMIGPERGRYRHKVPQLIADAEAAEQDGFTSIWVPQIPGDFDAFTMITLLGRATQRVELGTAVLPIQTRHPIAMAQELLSNQAVCEGRFTLGPRRVAPLGHRGPARPPVRAAGAPDAQLPRGPERGPRRPGLGGRRERRRTACTARWTSRTTAPIRSCSRRSRPVMLRVAGELASGTILWMADERAIAEHVVPRITKAAAAAGRPAPRIIAGVPVALCPKDEVDAAREWANRVLGHAEYSPNYQRLLEQGDANDVGDILAAGDESAVIERLRSFRDAGVTDLAVRILALGRDRDARIESRKRTEAFLASLCPEL